MKYILFFICLLAAFLPSASAQKLDTIKISAAYCNGLAADGVELRPGNAKLLVLDPGCSKNLYVFNRSTYEYVKTLDQGKNLYEQKITALEASKKISEDAYNTLKKDFDQYSALAQNKFVAAEKNLIEARKNYEKAKNTIGIAEEEIKKAQKQLKKAQRIVRWQRWMKPGVVGLAGGLALGFLIGGLK